MYQRTEAKSYSSEVKDVVGKSQIVKQAFSYQVKLIECGGTPTAVDTN